MWNKLNSILMGLKLNLTLVATYTSKLSRCASSTGKGLVFGVQCAYAVNRIAYFLCCHKKMCFLITKVTLWGSQILNKITAILIYASLLIVPILRHFSGLFVSFKNLIKPSVLWCGWNLYWISGLQIHFDLKRCVWRALLSKICYAVKLLVIWGQCLSQLIGISDSWVHSLDRLYLCPCVRVKQAVISPRAVQIQGLATTSLFCNKVIHNHLHESANHCSYHTDLTLKSPNTAIIPKITTVIK